MCSPTRVLGPRPGLSPGEEGTGVGQGSRCQQSDRLGLVQQVTSTSSSAKWALLTLRYQSLFQVTAGPGLSAGPRPGQAGCREGLLACTRGAGAHRTRGLAEQSSGLRGGLLSPPWGQVRGWQGRWLPGPGARRISSFLFVRLWAGLQPAGGSALRGAEGPGAYKHGVRLPSSLTSGLACACLPQPRLPVPTLGLGLWHPRGLL